MKSEIRISKSETISNFEKEKQIPRGFRFGIWVFGFVSVFVFRYSVFSHEQSPTPTKISSIRDFIQHLQWSPDGKKFLFTRIHAGKMGLWTMDVGGTELKQLLAKHAQPHF